MKHLFKLTLSIVLVMLLCTAGLYAFYSEGTEVYFLECEDGVITGAAKDYKDGNIQDVGIASGGKIVGLGGVSDAPQMASWVTFADLEIPVSGVYAVTFCYDTNAGDTKKADIVIDDVRYNVPINMDELPELYGEEFRDYTLEIELSAGKHTFAVTTAEDFNRDSAAGPVVKSVNADYIRIALLAEIAEPEPAPETPADEAPAEEVVESLPEEATPVTADMGMMASLLAFAAAAVVLVKRK